MGTSQHPRDEDNGYARSAYSVQKEPISPQARFEDDPPVKAVEAEPQRHASPKPKQQQQQQQQQQQPQEDGLRPEEEEWREVLGRLCERFPAVPEQKVVEAL